MWKLVRRALLGFLVGYAVYLPVTLVVEFALYGRIDSEREIYALPYAVGAPFLLFPSNRIYLQDDELILNIAGAVLIVAGILIATNERIRKRLFGWFASVPHP
jgi:hypothetical protein